MREVPEEKVSSILPNASLKGEGSECSQCSCQSSNQDNDRDRVGSDMALFAAIGQDLCCFVIYCLRPWVALSRFNIFLLLASRISRWKRLS